MAANEARVDLRQKLILERELLQDLRRFNKQLVRNTVKAQSNGDATFIAARMQPELERILRSHYTETGSAFDNQIGEILPEDIAETPAEREAIIAALALFYNQRAPEQASIITDTNQRDINIAQAQSQEMGMADIAAGRQTSVIEMAFVAGAILNRKLNGRISTIASFETQVPAEAAKLTEADILSGQPPSVVVGSNRPSDVTKEWVTVGDEVVRPAHATADAQVKDMNLAFLVGGDLLRFPGDNSLGATLKNIINCRCSSVISREDVFAVRRRRGEVPFMDVTASDQLLTSIGG